MEFKPLADFYSPETRSQYCAGLKYTARTEHLQALVPQWVDEGKVAILKPGEARIEGRGAVVSQPASWLSRFLRLFGVK